MSVVADAYPLLVPTQDFEPYRGSLTPEEAARGIEVAYANATNLLGDADALLHAKRWPRAAALAILAIEEAGKGGILRGLLLARTDEERKAEWRAYRHHMDKNMMARFMEFLMLFMREAGRAPGIQDLRSFTANKDARRQTDLTKQLALYTDCVGDARWTIPDEVINEEMARAMVHIANEVVGSAPGAMTSVEELRLWVKHLAPSWKTDMATMKRALAACYGEAAATGVLRGDVAADRMAEFLNGTESTVSE